MKKVIGFIIAIVVSIGATLGLVLGIQACNNKKENTADYIKVEVMDSLEDTYTVGDMIVFNYYVYSDIEFVSLTYKINNGEAQNPEGFKCGEAVDHKKYDGEDGKYFIDTGAQVIDSSDMPVGVYTIILEGTAKDGGVYRLNKTPYIFEIVAVKTAE